MTEANFSLLQFNLRKCFWLLTGICVILAFTLPWVKNWPTNVRFEFFCQVAVLVAAFIVTAGCIAALRFRAERLCSKILFVAYPEGMQRTRKGLLLLAVFQSQYLVFPAMRLYSLLSHPHVPAARLSLTAVFLSFLSPALAGIMLALFAMNAVSFSRQLSFECGANGYIRGLFLFTPWNRIASYEWNSNKTGLCLRGRHWRTVVGIQPGDCEKVDEILAEKVPAPMAN